MKPSGSRRQEMATTYPDDCLQTLVNAWWVPHPELKLCRGALIWAFVPHVDQVPYTFTPIGRTDATSHHQADVKVAPLSVNQALKQTQLPVAAMPLNKNEVWAAYRAKIRPCLVLSEECIKVEKKLTHGMPNHASAPTVLVAPYYGADKSAGRAGYTQPFVDRIRHCEYPQYLWDKLPLEGSANESILRLDHVQPIGCHHSAYRVCDHKLSEEALEIVDTMLDWVMKGNLPDGHDILEFRKMMQEAFP